MSSNNRHRINFYSIDDMATPFELKNAKELLDNFTTTINFDINDFLEFYNVKKYFDNKLFLENWDEELREKYKNIVETIFLELKNHLIRLDDSNFENFIVNIEFQYLDNIWNLFNQLSLFNKISGECFLDIIDKNEIHIRYVLKNKKIVEKYDKKLKDFLTNFKESAEILLSKIEEKHTFGSSSEYYLPKSLSLKDKEIIIEKYIGSESPNLNYIRLIENSKDSTDLKLSAKTRLKAKKVSQKLNNEIFEKGHSWSIRVQVGISKDQTETVTYNNRNESLEIVYSERILNSCLGNDIKLIHIFSQLFQYLDETNLITIVSKYSEIDSFERTFMQSKNSYEIGEVFTRKEYLSNLQLIIFDDFLKRNNNSLEKIINSFIDHLNNKISPAKFYFQIRINNSPYIDKIRSITPDYDFLLKQFKLLAEDGEIDLELIQLDSKPIYLSDVYSLNDKKYIYSNNDIILYLKYVFFSNQSMLYYVKEFKNKYKNFYELLVNENIKIEDFENYQKREIEKLINDKYLLINEYGYIKIKNDIQIFIIGQIHLNEVVSYWIYPKLVREEIDNLLNDNLLKYENTLFSIPEKNYINYYLNKKEYTNGFDLRNKYLHGTNSFSDDEHKMDYFRLLKIIILTLLKIEDDIKIYQK